MIDSIRKLTNRLRPAQNITQALAQIVSPALVARLARAQAPALLPEAAAEELFLDRRELLMELATRLELPYALEVRTPAVSLIQRLGKSAEFLRERWALPQSCPLSRHGYRLLVADTEGVDIEAFQKAQIPVYLTLASLVDDAWRRFGEGHGPTNYLSAEQLSRILSQLARDAEQLGAGEVRIGINGAEHYECSTGEQQYGGKIHPLVLPSLNNLLANRPVCEIASTENSICELRVMRAPNETVVLAWRAAPVVSAKRRPEIITAASSVTALAANGNAAESKPQVLLVEDDRHFALILQKILENKGWQVRHANNGLDALEVLATGQFEPELIISDVHMPQCDGAELLRRLRAERPALPVLMLTSDDDALVEAELAALGATAFVRKQSDPRILLAWCYNLLGRTQQLFAQAANA